MHRACRQAYRNQCPYPAQPGHSSCCYLCHFNRYGHPRPPCRCTPTFLAPHVCTDLCFAPWPTEALVAAAASAPSVAPAPSAPLAPSVAPAPSAPFQPDAEREPESTEPGTRHHCQLITLGFHGALGWYLLRRWANRHRVIDVRDWLTQDLPRTHHWGTHQSTQQEIRRQPRFDTELLPLVMGRCLLYPVVVLDCTAGHHRSVATAEIASQELARAGVPARIEVVHVDATEGSAEQWERLCEL